jgi:hypothetical protein
VCVCVCVCIYIMVCVCVSLSLSVYRHFECLEVLDGQAVTVAQRADAERVYCAQFERFAYGRTQPFNTAEVLKKYSL